jgi:hypothetical protein
MLILRTNQCPHGGMATIMCGLREVGVGMAWSFLKAVWYQPYESLKTLELMCPGGKRRMGGFR